MDFSGSTPANPSLTQLPPVPSKLISGEQKNSSNKLKGTVAKLDSLLVKLKTMLN